MSGATTVAKDSSDHSDTTTTVAELATAKSTDLVTSATTVDASSALSEACKPTQKVAVRKLTRSSSTRKSKHLTAIFNPGKPSDTDSADGDNVDVAGGAVDSKVRSISKSPVKRAPGNLSKTGNSKANSRSTTKPMVAGAGSPLKRTPTAASQPEERRCTVDGCDSVGHLGGRMPKHFTPEACPVWHGFTLTETRQRADERAKCNEARRKATILFEADTKQPSVEQKSYQMKIRETRSKFIPQPASPSVRAAPTSYTYRGAHRGEQHRGEPQHEPNLAGLVSDYDLQLFREAQAMASERIEDELRLLPAGKGTK